jgi:mRNA interferase MazF
MLPEIGDVAWVELDPVLGTEQAGRRPALVLSDRAYHEVSRRAVVCPISIRARPWAFNVPLPEGMITTGMVLVDQIRTIDRAQRMFAIIEHAPDAVIADVRGRLAALLRLDQISLLPDQGGL